MMGSVYGAPQASTQVLSLKRVSEVCFHLSIKKQTALIYRECINCVLTLFIFEKSHSQLTVELGITSAMPASRLR